MGSVEDMLECAYNGRESWSLFSAGSMLFVSIDERVSAHVWIRNAHSSMWCSCYPPRPLHVAGTASVPLGKRRTDHRSLVATSPARPDQMPETGCNAVRDFEGTDVPSHDAAAGTLSRHVSLHHTSRDAVHHGASSIAKRRNHRDSG